MDYIIERTTDNGRTEQYLSGRIWVDDKADAERMTFEEAEQLASDWTDHAAMTGRPALFNVASAEASPWDVDSQWAE